MTTDLIAGIDPGSSNGIVIQFTVFGRPVPQGSMRAFRHKTTGAVVSTSDNKRTKPWKQEVAQTAMSLGCGMFDRDTPVEITMNFYFTRPKSAAKRKGMTVKPDGDKLVRSIFDAITGVLIVDDAQIVEHYARKHYGGPERCEIRIQEAIC